MKEERRAAPPEKPGRRKVFDIVIVLVVVALAIVIIQSLSGATSPASYVGATLHINNGTAGPGETGAPGGSAGTPVIISELMASNSGAITAEDGNYYDWIELYNRSGQAVNLAGYAISDNLKKPTKLILPSWTLEAGEYVVIHCTGTESSKTELHCPFSLKSSGELLTLVDPNGREVQRVTFPVMKTNVSFAADMQDTGNFTATDKYTPGYANTNEGYAAYMSTRRAASEIVISEVMATNTLTIRDEDGEYSDWVEIFNGSDSAVDLAGWGLSDRVEEPKRWVFPAVTVEPGKFIVVYVSGKNRAAEGKELHADFRLNGFKDAVLLSNRMGQIVSEVQINDLASDASFGMVPGTENWQVFTHPTPGLANTEEGFNSLQPKLYENAGEEPVIISEVMASNQDTYMDQFEEYPDWIELYNRSNADVNLKGWGLTDKSDELGRWKFPDITIAAGERLVVFASERNLTDDDAVSKKKLHTDFNIGGDGAIVALTAPDGRLADRCLVPGLLSGVTYGRAGVDMLFSYSTQPTPGAENAGGYPGYAEAPVFSLAAGVYSDDVKVVLACFDPNATIYYTVNGDPPTDKSTPYAGPIEVKKPAEAKTLGGTVIRAVAYRDGYLPSNGVCNTYIIENGIEINLPILSIAVDNHAMFDPSTGMYTKGPNAEADYPFEGANFWKDMELPAHIELIETDGTVGISQVVGMQIAGQFSRGDVYKAFDLIARAKYGKNSIDYAIFPDQPSASYKAVVSRPGGQDVKYTGMRDVLVGSLSRDTISDDASGGPSVFVQDYRTVLEFVNGEFWGVTHIREKVDTHTMARHYPGVDETRLDILQGTGDIVKAGSKADFKDLIAYAKEHDLTNPEYYKYVTDRMDVDSYINWFTLEICCGNSDMANIRMWRSPNLDNKWRWIFYDFCWTFHTIDRSDIKNDIDGTKTGASTNRALIQALLKNTEFRDKFLKQLAYNINVTFETDRVLQRIDEIAATMQPYMEAQSKKWRELSKENPHTTGYANWEGQVEKLRKYAREHPMYLKQQMKDYFNLTDAQMQEYFGS